MGDEGLELSWKSRGKPGISGSVVPPVVPFAPEAAAGNDQRAVALKALAGVWRELPDDVIAKILRLVQSAQGRRDG